MSLNSQILSFCTYNLIIKIQALGFTIEIDEFDFFKFTLEFYYEHPWNFLATPLSLLSTGKRHSRLGGKGALLTLGTNARKFTSNVCQFIIRYQSATLLVKSASDYWLSLIIVMIYLLRACSYCVNRCTIINFAVSCILLQTPELFLNYTFSP